MDILPGLICTLRRHEARTSFSESLWGFFERASADSFKKNGLGTVDALGRLLSLLPPELWVAERLGEQLFAFCRILSPDGNERPVLTFTHVIKKPERMPERLSAPLTGPMTPFPSLN